MNPVPFLFALAAVVSALALGLWWSSRLWAVADTPTVPAGHAFPGRVEVRGRATRPPGSPPLTSPLTGASCAWWSAEVQEETGSGKDKEWKRRALHVSGRIAVRDDSGHVLVDLPDTGPIAVRSETLRHDALPPVTSGMLRMVASGAPLHEITAAAPGPDDRSLVAKFVERVVTRFSDDLDLSSAGSDWRVIERRVDDGDELYVLGRATVTGDGLLLATGDGVRLIAFRGGEQRLLRRLRWQSRSALAAFVVGTGVLAAAVSGTAGRPDGSVTDGVAWDVPIGLLAAWLALLGILAVQAVRIRNRIVAAREQVLASWRLIGIADQRRATLVPALSEVVRAAMAHESTVLQLLAAARAGSEKAAGSATVEHLAASTQAHEAARRALLALREAMPALRTSANATRLIEELVHLEDGVAVARGYYTDAWTVLSDRLQTIPDAWFAPITGAMPPPLSAVPGPHGGPSRGEPAS